MKKIISLFCLLSLSSLYAQETDSNVINVELGVADANPPIFLETTGSAQEGELMKKTLLRSDWFTLVNKQSEAQYIAKFEAVGGEVLCRLYDKTGKFLGGWKQNSTQNKYNAIFALTDKIIETAMKTPGQCSSKILFAAGNGKVKEIFSCNFDGTELIQLTKNQTFSTEPSWIPGKNLFVYTYYTSSAMNIAQYNLNEGTHRRICQYPGLNSSPTVSPDGKWLTVCLSRDGKVDLYLRAMAESRELVRLTNDTHVESSPTWNGDQTQICYVSDKSGRPRLYILDVQKKSSQSLRPMLYNLDKSGEKGAELGEYGVQMVGPSWSPVSNKIAYSVFVGGRYAIAVVDMSKDRNSAVIITSKSGNWEDPCWAPDGRHLVCSRSIGGSRSLWQIDSIYGTAIQITNPSKIDHSLPSWKDGKK